MREAIEENDMTKQEQGSKDLDTSKRIGTLAVAIKHQAKSEHETKDGARSFRAGMEGGCAIYPSAGVRATIMFLTRSQSPIPSPTAFAARA